MKHHAVFCTLSLALFAGSAAAQPAFRAVFVGNNGNLEGSVTTYRVNADNSLSFSSKYVTGSRPSTTVPEPGSNVAAVALRPDGRFLAAIHATENNVTERITMLRVNADGTLSPPAGPGSGLFATPDAPLDGEWVDNQFLAVLQTAAGNLFIYRYNEALNTLTLVSSAPTGGFTSTLAIHPSRRYVITRESTGRTVRAFPVDPATGALGAPSVSGFGQYSLGVGVSPDGTRVFGGGGISGNVVTAFSFNAITGVLTPTPGAPFASPGSSPKQVAVSGDNRFALVAHGTDATVRVLAIDQVTGVLTDTGFSFDVGFQGSLGEVVTQGAQMFVTDRDTINDGVRGTRSFTVNIDGSLTQNGTMVDSTGVSPSSIQAWAPPPPPCAADINSDGRTDTADLVLFLSAFGSSVPPGTSGDFDSSGFVDTLDLLVLLGAFGCGA
ncbi:MAG: hypothetical protein J0L61_12675 [Planctomycetes bacterium]|nr:hypothetical protein [Planctomycetota bacterium]